MKKLKMLLFAFLLVGIVSCSDDGDDNPANNNNGDFGLNAVVETDNQGNMEYDFGVAYYDEEDQNTAIILVENQNQLDEDSPGEIENGLFIILDGKSTGEYDLSFEDNTVFMGMNSSVMVSSMGSVDVTQYPEPGGELKFSLNAKMMTIMGENSSNISCNTISVKFVKEEDLDDPSNNDDNSDNDDSDDNSGDKDNSDISSNLEKLVLKIDGEGFDNEYVTFNMMSIAYSAYNDNADQTTVTLVGGIYDGETHVISLTVNFEGKEPDEFSISGQSANKNFMNFTLKGTPYGCTEGTIKVNQVGNVGELTKFKFNGTFEEMTGNASFEVTEGEVWVKRDEF